MLAVFLSTLVLVGLAMLAMGVGLLLGRGAPQGSCGGLGVLGLKGDCELCAGRERCLRRERQSTSKEY